MKTTLITLFCILGTAHLALARPIHGDSEARAQVDSSPSSSAPVEIQTTDGKSLKGEFISLDNKELKLKTADGLQQLPVESLLNVKFRGEQTPRPKHCELGLIDGSMLRCEEVTFDKEGLSAKLLSGNTLEIPLSKISYFIRNPENSDLRSKFWNHVKNKSIEDRIAVLRSDDLNVLEGTVGKADATQKTILFQMKDRPSVAILIERLYGIIPHKAVGKQEALVGTVVDSHGTTFEASLLSFDGKRHELTTPSGVRISLSPEQVSQVRFDINRVLLAELTPKVTEKSNSGLLLKYAKNKSLSGDPIRLANGKEYKTGLSIHAHTELEFNLEGKYRQFQTDIGIDPEVINTAKPRVQIIADGITLFDEVIEGERVLSQAIPVRDAQRLRIVVSSTNPLDLHDQVTLGNARLIR